MKRIILTPSERQLILKRRAAAAEQIALEKFQEKALNTANRWVKWSRKDGSGLTLSTFVNSFNYQDSDGEQMYAAVQKILEVVCELGGES